MHWKRSQSTARCEVTMQASLPNTPQEARVKAASPPPETLGISAVQTAGSIAKLRAPSPRPATGFLLLDAACEPISFNAEVVRILCYPDKVVDLTRLDHLITEKIHSNLIHQQPEGDSPFVSEFQSGRRRYFCRVLSGLQFKDPSSSTIAMLLERGPAGLVPLSQVSERFHLTRREREVLEHLLQGLTNKEIGVRMNISPNTVKAFLRLVMNKMGVSSRSALLPKIIMTHSR